MKVLGISGSPRTGGNTDILLDKALEGSAACGAQIDKIILNDLNIHPCQEEEYDNVTSDGFSVVDDGIQVVYEKIKASDALILASPIFFGSLSAQTKTMIDRFQCVWLAKKKYGKEAFSGKTGGFICVEATTREDFFDNARSIVRHFFATINVKYAGEVLCPGVEKKGDILRHLKSLEKACEMGKALALARKEEEQQR